MAPVLAAILAGVLPISTLQASNQPPAAARVEIVFTNDPALPSSLVPGLGGVRFKPGDGSRVFGDVVSSPAGRWATIAFADLPPGQEDCLIVDGALVLRASDIAPWPAGTEIVWRVNSLPAVNDAGDFAAFVTTNGGGSNVANEYVATFVGGAWGFAARESDPVPAFPGAEFGELLDSPFVLADGRVGHVARDVRGAVASGEDDLLVVGANVIAQQGVTVPTGQWLGTTRALDRLVDGSVGVTPDGAHWIAAGTLVGAASSDDVLLVDGVVVLQERAPIPGLGGVETVRGGSLLGAHIDAAGQWYALAQSAPSREWVALRNGVPAARDGDAALVGAPLRWRTGAPSGGMLMLCAGNARGDVVVAGTTDEPDASRDAVLALNGDTLVLREGDPVDLDGDGAFDDDAFVAGFDLANGRLDERGVLRTVLSLRDGAGASRGRALVAIDVDGVGDGFCSAAPNSTGAGATIRAHGSRDVGRNDLTLECSAMPPGAAALFLASRAQGFVANPGGSAGNLCLGGAIGRFAAPGQVLDAGPLGQASLDVDLARHPSPSGLVAVAPGETWNYTCWFRDAAGGVTTSNFSDGVTVRFE